MPLGRRRPVEISTWRRRQLAWRARLEYVHICDELWSATAAVDGFTRPNSQLCLLLRHLVWGCGAPLIDAE